MKIMLYKKKQSNQELLDTQRAFEDACRLSSLSMAVVASDIILYRREPFQARL